MKLIDLFIQLDKEGLFPKNKEYISGAELKGLEKKLFECDEFKRVVRINYIETPNYLIDKETEEPLGYSRDFLGGETSTKTVQSFRVNQNQDLILNKIVDIYSIQLVKTFSTSAANIDTPGVWIFPTIYNNETFVPKQEIRVIWNPEQLQNALAMMGNSESVKDRLKRMFEDALDNMEPNIPCDYSLLIRGSERSIVAVGQEFASVEGGPPPDSNNNIPGDANPPIE